MKKVITIFVCFMLLGTASVFAHRLDEYLQAATFRLEANRVVLQLRLTPGTQVSAKVLAAIDSNGDGLLSRSEKQGYVELVQHDLSIYIDGQVAPLKLISSTFSELEEMQKGLGDILLTFETALPPDGTERKLLFENHHLKAISVYLVNCLVPANPNLQVTAQDRNYTQSSYELAFTDTAISTHSPAGFWLKLPDLFGQTGSASQGKAFFYHGIHHILTGYDHLLFISALVLAATTFWQLIKVVTAFTLAHTITLTLATFNIVHLPQMIVEPLIAASIVVVALQNVFWPDKAKGWSRLGAAFFFGLFHGLGFAGGLIEAMREMPTGTMLLAIGAFSIGIEAGHQMIVLPLFGLLKTARRSQPTEIAQVHLFTAIQRIGSAGISIAGVYYLCLALLGNS